MLKPKPYTLREARKKTNVFFTIKTHIRALREARRNKNEAFPTIVRPCSAGWVEGTGEFLRLAGSSLRLTDRGGGHSREFTSCKTLVSYTDGEEGGQAAPVRNLTGIPRKTDTRGGGGGHKLRWEHMQILDKAQVLATCYSKVTTKAYETKPQHTIQT